MRMMTIIKMMISITKAVQAQILSETLIKRVATKTKMNKRRWTFKVTMKLIMK